MLVLIDYQNVHFLGLQVQKILQSRKTFLFIVLFIFDVKNKLV